MWLSYSCTASSFLHRLISFKASLHLAEILFLTLRLGSLQEEPSARSLAAEAARRGTPFQVELVVERELLSRGDGASCDDADDGEAIHAPLDQACRWCAAVVDVATDVSIVACVNVEVLRAVERLLGEEGDVGDVLLRGSDLVALGGCGSTK